MNGSGGPSNKGGGGLKKTFFQLFGPQFGLEIIEIRGGGGDGSPGPLPWIRHWVVFRRDLFRLVSLRESGFRNLRKF